jgi:putative SOS response-associated peptidase YedK
MRTHNLRLVRAWHLAALGCVAGATLAADGPTQLVPAVRAGEDKGREFVMLKWGLIPSWAKDATIANSLINARGETVATKPSFLLAFRKRRCLVVADGFYEWDKFGATAKGAKKQPWHFHLKTREPFGIAALWEWWRNPADHADERETCTLVTTEANELLAPVHDRMPVILHRKDFDRWLDPEYQNAEAL